MFNKNKVRKVNDLLDIAENCLNNKDRENARKAMEESYNLIKKISGYDKTKLSVRWMEIAEKSDNLAEEIANAGLTEEQKKQLLLNSVEAAFTSGKRKRELKEQFLF